MIEESSRGRIKVNELIVKKMGMRTLAWNFEGYYNIGNKKMETFEKELDQYEEME